jgi:hypothetical protein
VTRLGFLYLIIKYKLIGLLLEWIVAAVQTALTRIR